MSTELALAAVLGVVLLVAAVVLDVVLLVAAVVLDVRDERRRKR